MKTHCFAPPLLCLWLCLAVVLSSVASAQSHDARALVKAAIDHWRGGQLLLGNDHGDSSPELAAVDVDAGLDRG